MRDGTGSAPGDSSAEARSRLAIKEVVYEFNKPLVEEKASAIPPICHATGVKQA
jgi:hypothetical protein